MQDLSQTPWDQFPSAAAPTDLVSPNFRFYELTRSTLADRRGIDNAFVSSSEARAAVYLCRNVLQPVRDVLGRFSPTSVYRSQALERALKKKPGNWTSSSQHTRGEAADIEVPGLATIELASWIADNLEFDQLICECYNPSEGPNSGWVHVSLVPPGEKANRRQILSYIWNRDRQNFVFVPGLQESYA